MDAPGPEPAGKELVDRRSVVAGAAALAGAAAAKLASSDEARAGHDSAIGYSDETVVHVGVTNTSGATSTRVSANVSGTAAFVGLNNYPVGISRPDGILGRTRYTTSGCAGVAGSCEAASGGIGVLGTSVAANGVGIFGFSGSNVPQEDMPPGSGVFGIGANRGVSGRSTLGAGLYGYAGPEASDLGPLAGTGVFGRSAGGVGVQGESASGHGVRGVTAGNDAAVRGTGPGSGVGVEGVAGTGVRGTTDSGVGVHGVATGSGVAGRFVGRTVVEGLLETSGPPPAAVVNGARTYAHAGLAPAFEHVGEARLRRGRATVRLPAAFDALVPGRRYQVFLTEYGNHGGLYVPARGQRQFKVRSRRRRARGRFGYRIVALRSDLRS
jgi:hypothetical protein